MNEYRTAANAWGLTGGIGSGKSMAADILRRLGIPVLDMDRLAAGLMVPGTVVYREIVGAFGGGIVGTDGWIDRRRLAALVFSDRERLRLLESIVHPATLQETARRLNGDALRTVPLVFVESAIVFEASMDDWLKGVAVVTAPLETRIRRVMARDNASAGDVADRIAAQMDDSRRTSGADAIWHNDTNRETLRNQIIDTICGQNSGMLSAKN